MVTGGVSVYHPVRPRVEEVSLTEKSITIYEPIARASGQDLGGDWLCYVSVISGRNPGFTSGCANKPWNLGFWLACFFLFVFVVFLIYRLESHFLSLLLVLAYNPICLPSRQELSLKGWPICCVILDVVGVVSWNAFSLSLYAFQPSTFSPVVVQRAVRARKKKEEKNRVIFDVVGGQRKGPRDGCQTTTGRSLHAMSVRCRVDVPGPSE